MKRIGIITLYDCYHEIDVCTQKLICEFRKYLDYTFVVCNYNPNKEGNEFLCGNSDHVLIRDNVGFDGGAIKDAIAHLFSEKSDIALNDFDELLILNDTFYGFINPIQPFFDWFRTSDNDFAGLTKNEGGYLWLERHVPAHVQGYAIIIKKRMFMDSSFRDFWRDLNYPATSTDNIFNFEYGFSAYFSNNGFKFDAYYDLNKYGLSQNGDVDYLDHPYELMKYEKYPIYKYKAAWIEYMNDSCYEAMLLIKRRSIEEFGQIMRHVMKSSNRMYVRQDKLIDFCNNRQKVYIYGCGGLGKRIFNFLRLIGYECKGFIVSHASFAINLDSVNDIDDVSLEQDEGIIVGMNKKHTLEIKEYLDAHFESEQLFYPNLRQGFV